MPKSNRASATWELCPKTLIRLSLLIGLSSEIAAGQAQRPPVPPFSFMQLRLLPAIPAARPASLGGAFIGIANDATAAAINPAGLSYLSQPEVSLSHVIGMQAREYPIGRGDHTLGRHRDDNPLFDQTLVNIVYPHWGFTFALYRQLAFQADFDFTRNQFLTIAPSRPLTLHEQLGVSGNFPGLASNFSLHVVHNALVVAKTLHRRFRFGASLAATQFRLQLHERHYFDPDLWLRPGFNATLTTLGENRAESLYRLYDLELNEFKLSWNTGVLFELDPALTIGLVYQHLPSFKAVNLITMPVYRLPDRSPENGQNDEMVFAPLERRIPFKIDLPDNAGAGLAWQPSNKVLIALDAVWRRNDSLLQGLNLNLPQDDRLNEAGIYADPDGQDDVKAKNQFTFHGGLEYRVIKPRIVWPLRLGFYTESNLGLEATTTDINLKREYPVASPRFHFTWGVGAIIKNKNIRFEFSGDISSYLFEAIGSAVFGF
jgi:long-subunit fatty acid transport protein